MLSPGYPRSKFTVWSREAILLSVAAAGGACFALFGAPAAWLSGSMLFVTVAGLLRPMAVLRTPWFDATMLLSGVLIGSAATPEALAAASRYPGSLALMLVAMAAIMIATGAYLHYVARWSWIDSLLAAAPGALSAVVAVAEAKGANLGRIAVVQLFRILVLVALLPGVMQISAGEALGLPPPAPVAALPEFALLLAAGYAGGLLFERLNITAPMILGPAFASGVLHGTGLVTGSLPPEIVVVTLVFLGAVMGGRVSTLKRGEILALFPLAIGGFFVSMAVALVFAWPAAWVAGVPYATAMAAFAPGGLEAMAMLAFAMGLDPLYVGAHHLVRFVGVGLVMPLVVSRLKPEKPPG